MAAPDLKFWILDVKTDSGFVSEYCSRSVCWIRLILLVSQFLWAAMRAVGEQELQHCLPFKQVHVP